MDPLAQPRRRKRTRRSTRITRKIQRAAKLIAPVLAICALAALTAGIVKTVERSLGGGAPVAAEDKSNMPTFEVVVNEDGTSSIVATTTTRPGKPVTPELLDDLFAPTGSPGVGSSALEEAIAPNSR